jgi:PTS system cellobiose-specific IIB component
VAKRYSIAEARNGLTGIVHEVERGGQVEITRRGKRVAVLVSTAEYGRLTGGKRDLWEAIEKWRESVDWDVLGDIDDVWVDVRDRSPGRDFRW